MPDILDSEKKRFIETHEAEIVPLFLKEKYFQLVEAGRLDPILKKFAVRIYTRKVREGGQHALLAANDPGSYNVLSGLVRDMHEHPDCGRITTVISGQAGQNFEKELGDYYHLVPCNKILPKLLTLSAKKPFDVAVVTVSSHNSPSTLLWYGGKSCLGSSRLYLVADGWTGLGDALVDNAINADSVDGIVCNDEIAKAVYENLLPDNLTGKILPLGTPVLQSIELEKANIFRKIGREKLNISSDSFTILYLGDVQSDYPAGLVHEDINGQSFGKALDAVSKLSQQNPQQRISFLFRPHPRDSAQDNLLKLAQQRKGVSNLTVNFAGRGVMSMNEAGYAADVILSLASTENFLAPRRGKLGIFLGFEEKDLGGDLLRTLFPPQIIRTIQRQPGIEVVSSPEHLQQVLQDEMDRPRDLLSLAAPRINYSRIINNLLFRI